MNDLDNEMKKLRDEYEAQMQNMISDMNQQDQLSKQEVEAERVIVRELTLKYEEVFNENEMNKSALEEFGLHAQQKEEELLHLHTELENQRTLANNLQNEMNENLMAFKHSQQEMSDRLTEGISRNS
jgi:16S rRNA C1402 (ribose-2'-O) methylase RsmI